MVKDLRVHAGVLGKFSASQGQYPTFQYHHQLQHFFDVRGQ
jgi:hypothetical protein